MINPEPYFVLPASIGVIRANLGSSIIFKKDCFMKNGKIGLSELNRRIAAYTNRGSGGPYWIPKCPEPFFAAIYSPAEGPE